MGEKFSFFVVSNTGSVVRRITFSKSFLTFMCLIVSAGLVYSGYLVYDYTNLKKKFVNAAELESRLSGQTEIIAGQRRQIQRFSKEINTLKTDLLALNDFEKKIRIIANLEKPAGKDSLFGVGGSIPEDLEAKIDLTDRHNSLLREMHEQVGQLKLASTNQNEGFESLLTYLEKQRNLLASTPAVSPTKGWITSRFGYRISPFTGKREFHKGLDIGARKKSPIMATANGTVTYVGNKGQLGRVITIDHGHGVVTRYGHIHKAMKKRGEPIKRGEKIALVGNTGRTTGSHVHYEILLNGMPVNPLKYILD
ncbi:M23 family metallopeptidase [Thermodesulfobacteriota bacterium]